MKTHNKNLQWFTHLHIYRLSLAKDFDKAKDDFMQLILDVFKEEGDNSF